MIKAADRKATSGLAVGLWEIPEYPVLALIAASTVFALQPNRRPISFCLMQTETYTVSLPSELAAFVRRKLASGEFSSASEVIRDALREHREHEAAREAARLDELMADAPAREPSRREWSGILKAQKQARAEMQTNFKPAKGR